MILAPTGPTVIAPALDFPQSMRSLVSHSGGALDEGG
jgi:hypothetical protein